MQLKSALFVHFIYTSIYSIHEHTHKCIVSIRALCYAVFAGSFFGSCTTVHCCSLRFMWKIRLLVSVSVAASFAVAALVIVVVVAVVGLASAAVAAGFMKTVL